MITRALVTGSFPLGDHAISVAADPQAPNKGALIINSDYTLKDATDALSSGTRRCDRLRPHFPGQSGSAARLKANAPLNRPMSNLLHPGAGRVHDYPTLERVPAE